MTTQTAPDILRIIHFSGIGPCAVHPLPAGYYWAGPYSGMVGRFPTEEVARADAEDYAGRCRRLGIPAIVQSEAA